MSDKKAALLGIGLAGIGVLLIVLMVFLKPTFSDSPPSSEPEQVKKDPQLVPIVPDKGNAARVGDVLFFSPFGYPLNSRTINAKLRVVSTGAAVVYIGQSPPPQIEVKGEKKPFGFLLVRYEGKSRIRVRLVDEKDEVIEGYEETYIVNAVK